MEKNNKGIIALLVVLVIILSVLCVLFATNTISFNSNSIDTGNNQSNDVVNDSTTDGGQVTSTWTSYLLSGHILEAKISRIRSKDLGDSEDINKTITISIDDLKELLTKLENNKLSKTWSSGMGGPIRDSLVISYEKNNQKYVFELHNDIIDVSNVDDQLKDILEKAKYDEKYIEKKENPGVFYVYEINNYANTIFDKYFN